MPPKQATWPHRKVEAAILKTSGDQLVSSQLQTNYWVCIHKYENKTGDQLFISQCLANSCVPVCTISTNLDTTVTKNCITVWLQYDNSMITVWYQCDYSLITTGETEHWRRRFGHPWAHWGGYWRWDQLGRGLDRNSFGILCLYCYIFGVLCFFVCLYACHWDWHCYLVWELPWLYCLWRLQSLIDKVFDISFDSVQF